MENLVCKFVRNLGNEIIKNTCFVNDQLESWNGIIPNPIFKSNYNKILTSLALWQWHDFWDKNF